LLEVCSFVVGILFSPLSPPFFVITAFFSVSTTTMMSDEVDPDEELILFDDKRQREHRRRQSVITVDDTDVLLHKRATRRSILYGGESQGPKFWNQLKSAWKNHQQQSPRPSPTCVRDIQELEDHQQRAIFNAKPNFVTSYNNNNNNMDDDDYSVGIKEEHASHQSTNTTRTSVISSSSNGSMDTTSSFRPFSSVWDRLDAWSLKEHRRVQDYHATVEQQNEKIAAVSTTVVESCQGQDQETVMAPGIPAKRQFGPQGPTVSGTTLVAPHLRRGRLQRQHSWNGRHSSRDLLQARGSIMAIADEDGTLSDLWSALDSPFDDGQHQDNNGEEYPSKGLASSRLERITSPKPTSTTKKLNATRSTADQRVMDLVM
jgi:hypothetical protein